MVTMKGYILTCDGNVGIGTTSPKTKLEISDGSANGTGWIGNTTPQLAISSADAILAMVSSDDGTYGSTLSFAQVDSNIYENAWAILRETNGDGLGQGSLHFTYGTNADVYNNSKKVSILTDGSVGIGTDSPSQKLTVSGTLGVSEHLYMGASKRIYTSNGELIVTTSDFGNSQTNFKVLGDGTGSGVIYIGSVDNGSCEFVRANNGTSIRFFENSNASLECWKYGGTTTTHPKAKFYGWNNAGSAKDWLALWAGDTTNDGSYIQSYDSTGSYLPLLLNAYGGNVGIGKSSPLTDLDVDGKIAVGNGISISSGNLTNVLNLRIGQNSNGEQNGISFFESDGPFQMSIGYDGTGSGVANFIGIYNNNDDVIFAFRNGGSLGIGTTTPSQQLDITKSFNLTNTTNANQYGIIYKNDIPFIHDFNYGNNGTVTTEGKNIFIGENAGNLTMGSTASYTSESSYNIFIGHEAGYENTDGANNIFIGNGSGYSNTTGYSNTFIGRLSGYSNEFGTWNVFIGDYAGNSNIDAESNVFIGDSAGYENTDGSYNSFIGANSGSSNEDGENNTFVGYESGSYNTEGSDNTFIGIQSGYSNVEGYYNTFLGAYSGYTNDAGENNTAIGAEALYYIDASDNTAVGCCAGAYIDGDSENETSSASVYLGADTKALDDGDENEIVIGYDATGIGSNSVVLGNDSIETTALKGNVGIGTTEPSTKLDVNGALTLRELSSDPDDPDEGAFVIWMSDGSDTGDAGDILIKVTSSSTTKTITLVDFSAV
jgi:hypothetical protein